MTSDRLIDDVARAMTEAAAPADLRARVLQQIASAPERPRWSVVASPAIAAAAIAAVMFFSNSIRKPLDLPAVGSPPTVVATAVTGSATPSLEAVRPRARSTAPVISPDELAWLSRAVPALGTPPVVIDSIQPTALSIAPIDVEVLVLDPIAITPVGRGTDR